jgi:hypothetical protein
MVQTFYEDPLHWIEVMSLLGRIGDAFPSKISMLVRLPNVDSLEGV